MSVTVGSPAGNGLLIGDSIAHALEHAAMGLTWVSGHIFGSTSSATSNTTLINAALANGGYVYLGGVGTLYINGTLLIPSNTRFVIGDGVVIRRVQGTDAHMLRNVNANSTPFNITALTAIANGANGVGYLGHAVASGHNLSVGDYAFIAGAVPNDYNGVWQVVASVPGVSFDVLLSGFNGPVEAVTLTSPATVNSGTSGVNMLGIGTTSGSSVITLPQSNTGGFVVGMPVTCTNFTGTPTITSLNGGSSGQLTLSGTASATTVTPWVGTASFATNQMTITGTTSGTLAVGQYVVAAGVPFGTTIASGAGPYTLSATVGTIASESASTINPTTLTTSQYAYSSIIGCKADFNITIQGGTFYQDYYLADGSGFATTGLTTNHSRAVLLNRVRNLTVHDVYFDNCYDGLVPMSCYDATFENIDSRNTGSTLQMMSGGRNIVASNIRGQTHDVTVSFLVGDWPSWSDWSASGNQATGVYEFLTDVESLAIRDVVCTNALYAVQLSGQAGVKFRDVVVDGVTGACKEGQALITIYEDMQIGAGSTFDSLSLSHIRTDAQFPWTTAISISGGTKSLAYPTINSLIIDGSNIYVPSSAQSTSPYGVVLTGPMTMPGIGVTNSKFTGGSTASSQAISLGNSVTGQRCTLSVVEFAACNVGVLGGFPLSGAAYQFDNIHLNGSGALLSLLPPAATNCQIQMMNVHKSGAAVSNVFTNFSANSSGYFNLVNCDFSPTVGGAWIDASVSGNTAWRGTWYQPFNAYAMSGTPITPDPRFGTVQTHTLAAATTVNSALGVGGGTANTVDLTLVLTSDGASAYTFNAAYVLQANVGQVAQVLTGGAAATKMVLKFTYSGTKWVQVNGPQTWN